MYIGYRKQIKEAVKQEVVKYLQKYSVETSCELNERSLQTAKKRIATRLNCYQTEVFFVDRGRFVSNATNVVKFSPYINSITGEIYQQDECEPIDISLAVTNISFDIRKDKHTVFRIDPRYIGALDGCDCIIIKKESELWGTPVESSNIVGAISIGKTIMDECNPSTLTEKSARLEAVTNYIATVLPSIRGVSIEVPKNRLNNTLCFSIGNCEWETIASLLKIYNIDIGKHCDNNDNRITISLGGEATVKEAAKICRGVKLVSTRLARTRKI